jgi:hypothetical protein
MSKTNAFETAFLSHVFENADIPYIGDAAGLQNSATAGNLYFSLHTATLDDSAIQTTSEVAYTNYARVAVARSSAGWTVIGNAVAVDADVVFPAGGVGTSPTATNWGLGTDASGAAGTLLYYGAISPSIVCGNGVTPRLTAGTVCTED